MLVFLQPLMPQKKVNINAVLNQYNDSFQVFLSHRADLEEVGERCEGEIIFFEEDFQELEETKTLAILGWTNYIEAGNRAWSVDHYENASTNSTDVYAKMYGSFSRADANIAWLVLPVVEIPDVATNMYLSFETVYGYIEHDEPLELFISTDFDGDPEHIKTATWIKRPFKEPVKSEFKSFSEKNNGRNFAKFF